MNKETTKTEIARHLSSESETDLIEGVKSIIHRELLELDPSAKIVQSNHFNHSYIPDFVATWKDSGPVKERPVFLRFDLRSVYTRLDLERLPAGAMFIGLRDGIGERSFEPFRAESEEVSGGSLLTDSTALAEFSNEAASPLGSVLKANVVRGAKGVVDTVVAEELSDSVTATLGQTPEDHEKYVQFVQNVSRHFEPDAALRLKRSAQILRMGITGDMSVLDGEDGLAMGRLSDIELRTLIPYVLRSQNEGVDNVGFWRHIGSMLDLERLMAIGADLSDLDLTPFIGANTDRFQAKLARWEVGPTDEGSRGWRLGKHFLQLNTEQGAVQFANDGRVLKAEARTRLPDWDTVKGRFGREKLETVTLAGTVRQNTIESKDDTSVVDTCDQWNGEFEERFFVPTLSLRSSGPGEGGDRKISIDFVAGLAESRPPQTLNSLAVLLLEFMTPDAAGQLDLSEWLYLWAE